MTPANDPVEAPLDPNQPVPVVRCENPWVALAEAFDGTPLLDEWREEMAARRRLEADSERQA